MANNPDFQWSRFYYPEILNALISFKNTAWPEHTETDVHDPVVQLLRLYALIGHQQSVRLDHLAREQYIDTLRLRSSAIALAALVGYELALAVPADVDIVADLNSAASSGDTIVRSLSRFATEGNVDSPPITFEYLPAFDLDLTQDTGVYGFGSYTASAATPQTFDEAYDHTGSVLGATLFQTSGLLPAANRGGLLFFHPELMFNKIAIEHLTTGDISSVRFEYYDDKRVVAPDSVTDLGGTIRLRVNTLVGDTVNSEGLDVLVTCLRSGQQEWLKTTSSGSFEYVTTTGTLGQSTISTNAADYLVQTFWPELPNLSDGTSELTQPGDVTWNLPQEANRRWAKTTITDALGNEIGPAYFVRARIPTTSGTTAPTFDESTEPSQTTWSVLVEATQGRTYNERVGTTDSGSASQTFEVPRSPLLSVSQVLLSDGAWEKVDNFLSSTTFDRHYTLKEQPDGTQLITFGDGTNGKLPPATSAVTVIYRIGGEQSGNVGANSIKRDRTGNSKLKNIRNPRAATGWVEQEGITDATLDLVRSKIPASLRTLDRAVTPEDMEALAVSFKNADNDQVAERALAVEEGYGPKTVKLVVAGPGGIAPTQDQLDDLDEYFNGETVALQRIGGKILANTTLTSVAFTPRVVDVTATVSVLSDYSTGAQERIEAALQSVMQPAAKRLVLNNDGVWVESSQYLWNFNSVVSLAFIITSIATAIDGIVNVGLTTPAADITLAGDELPVSGTISITITVV